MGVKFVVDQPLALRAVRFYKDAAETGPHTVSVWTATGVRLATAPVLSESASGWQEQSLSTPVALTPGTTYVVSVGLNATFVLTPFGLSNQVVNGPLRSVADGRNGVFAFNAGAFPTNSVSASNYFVDVVVR